MSFPSPSLPVALTLIAVLTALGLIAFISGKAVKHLAKEEGKPSRLERNLYYLRTISGGLATVLASFLAYYFFSVGIPWLVDDPIGQIVMSVLVVLFTVLIVALELLALVAACVSLRLLGIEERVEGDDLENNREYQTLKALDEKLSIPWPIQALVVCVAIPFTIFLFIKFAL